MGRCACRRSVQDHSNAVAEWIYEMSPKSPERAQAFLDAQTNKLRNAARKDASRKLPAAAQLDKTPRDRSFNQMPFFERTVRCATGCGPCSATGLNS